MSNIYNLEPKTYGLVNLKTNFGDIELELFTKECPKATRNFVQNCLNGFYNGKSFERVEKDFIAVIDVSEDEDPCEPFRDEFHARLKFSRRGLLATANTKKDANSSKFFFTLGPTPELQNKHTIFGRARGDSVYKLVDLNECPVDDELRPIGEKRILETIVIENPYADLKPEPRDLKDNVIQEQDDADDYDPILKPKPKIGHSKKLSYGSDEDEDHEGGSGNEQVKPTIRLKQELEHDRAPGSPELKREGDDLESPNKRVRLESGEKSENKESADDREQRLRAIRQQIEDLKKQFENDSQTKSLSERRRERSTNSSIDSTKPQALDSSQSSGSVDLKNSSSISRKKEMIEDFNRKLKQLAPVPRANVVDEDRQPDLGDEQILDGDDWMNHTLEFPPDEEEEDAYSVLDSLKKESRAEPTPRIKSESRHDGEERGHRGRDYEDRHRSRDHHDDYDRRHRRDESRSDRKRHKHSRRHSSDRYYEDEDGYDRDRHHSRHRHH